MSSTPSPAASGTALSAHTTPTPNGSNSASGSTNGNNNNNNAAGNTGSRRPPRKSTLTQQQKNQKRQRATQDQLILLEVEFNKNPTPTASVRDRIAQEINMTERSVQIWFQNRRAKIKLLAKKSIETGEDCDAIPESYRNYLAMQAMESGKPLARNFMSQPMGFNGGMLLGGESHSPQKVVIHHFQCRSLTIGTWRRVGQNAMDLVIFYSLGDKPSLTYYINNDAAGYKIEFPFSYIKNITLENPQGDGSDGRYAGLLVELTRAPNFFMDNAGSGGFNQCGDFTEDQQASKVMTHHLGGDPRVLSGQLAKLLLLDTFIHRHSPAMDPTAIAASAPVSPVGHRPASQPNAAHHHMAMGFPDHGFGQSLHPGARVHKRTRSRSVPAITDFSFLNQPMPSFHVQHPSTTIADPSIFAPIPQHTGHLGPGSNLRINTAPGYGIDFRQYPMSAATTNSPSEYASPGFFGPGSDMDPMPSAGFQQSYNLPMMSPMHEHPHPLQTSCSPLSAVSHVDPVIADQSPPLSNMHRSASADFMMPQGQGLADDSLMFGDMYSKQNLNLPFRPQGLDESHFDMSLQEEPNNEGLDSQMYSNTINPSALSNENHGM